MGCGLLTPILELGDEVSLLSLPLESVAFQPSPEAQPWSQASAGLPLALE